VSHDETVEQGDEGAGRLVAVQRDDLLGQGRRLVEGEGGADFLPDFRRLIAVHGFLLSG
jgi:hypothetical protein